MSKDDVKSADFEKDDDKNFHIDFINAAANLRARNYRIPECDRQKTLMIAGKIIPAIATTTAMITGTVTTEIYKITQGFDNIEKYKNAFINLGLPLFVFLEPDGPKKVKTVEYDPILCGPVKAIPENYTIWDTIEINKSLTLREFITHIETEFGVTCSLLASGTLALYNSYLPGNKHEARMPMKIEDIYNSIAEIKMPASRTNMALDISGETQDEGEDVTMPAIKYTFA